jgi:hypothetical protein
LLKILDNLLIMGVLLFQTCQESWINFWLLHFSLKEHAEALGLLDVQGELSFEFLYLGELEGLLQV